MDRTPWARVAPGLQAASVPVIGLGIAVASITAPRFGSSLITSLTQLSPLLTLADVTTGIALIAAGSVAWLVGSRSAGLASVIAGATWFGLDWAGSVTAPDPVRALGLLAAGLTLPCLIAVVAFGVRLPPSRARTGVLLGSAAVIGTLTLAWLVAWIPRRDPRCLAVCGDNPLGLGIDDALARTLASAWQVTTLLLAVGLASWAGRYLWLASPRARRRDRGLLVPAIAVGMAWALWAGALLAPSGIVRPASGIAALAFAVRAGAATLLAGGLVARTLDEQRLRAAIRKVAARLSPPPGRGTLRALVGDAFGDPGLQLLFALPGGGSLVDGDGRPVVPPPQDRIPERRTEIRGADGVIAVAFHAPLERGLQAPDLGNAVLLAIDNERLLASVRHEMLELRASRARIVDAGDAARRRLERDLHDGAQQRMLGVLHELASARSAAAGAGIPDVTARLDGAIADTVATLEALRRLARGIHPAVLTEAGLSAALEALADRAPLPIVARGPGESRYAPATEAAAFRAASQLVALRTTPARSRYASASPSARAGCA